MGVSQGFIQSSPVPTSSSGWSWSLTSLGLHYLSPVSLQGQVGTSPFLLITPGDLASMSWALRKPRRFGMSLRHGPVQTSPELLFSWPLYLSSDGGPTLTGSPYRL